MMISVLINAPFFQKRPPPMTESQRVKRSDREYIVVLKFSELKSLSIPDFQRELDEKRVEKLYRNIDEKSVLPGVLIVCGNSGNHWLIDGHHRYRAYQRLYEEKKLDLKVAVQFIRVQDVKEAHRIFEAANDSKPIPRMPVGISLKDPQEVANYLYTTYPQIFSPSRACQRPHLNKEMVIEKIGLLISKHPNLTTAAIIERIHILNNRYRTELNLPENSTAYAKAVKKGGCFLGLVPKCGWVDEIITAKRGISAYVQHRLYEEMEGTCHNCDGEADIDDFDVSMDGEGRYYILCSQCSVRE
jgi:hypothetical protein